MSSQARQEFEDDGDWTERFIQAVQSKPPIYNTGLPEHSDRNLISRIWNEICETMVPTWQNMTSHEKSAKGRSLQSRWRNLKTCFRRELNKQKKGKSGQPTKRRKYIYFDQLLFLLPTMEDRPTVIECSPSITQEDKDNKDNSESDDEFQPVQTSHELQGEASNNTSQAGTSTQQPIRRPIRTKHARTNKPRYEESLLALLKEKEEEVIDEDKYFLLSLVPSFKKLNAAQKIDAKMEFLSTLKRFTQPGHETYPRYGPQGFSGNYGSPPHYYHRNVENYPSGSSTLKPVPSDVSRISSGSSLDSVSPLHDLDFS